ncbi:MAG: trypsin-like peptidase domain-containing protein [Bacilli bacterium]|nr:trypsin-like peptidase domain-containing protein [Bacilli bacterium]
MKKYLTIVLLIIVLVFTTAASSYAPKKLSIHYDIAQNVYVGETFSLKSNSLYTFRSTNEEVATYDEAHGLVDTLSAGYVVIQKINRETNEVVKSYTLLVKDEASVISVIGTNSMYIGDSYKFESSVYPDCADKEIIWSSSDTDVISIDQDGNATALKEGLATITATSKKYNNVYGSIYVMVKEVVSTEFREENYTIDSSNLSEAFEAVGRSVESSVIMVTGYQVSGEAKTAATVGCGLVYKRIAHLKDGSTTEENVMDLDTVENYEYYVITNKHIVASTTYNERTQKSTTTNYDFIGLYYGSSTEIGAKIIAYDEKIDLAVISFTSTTYFPIARLGDSDDLEAGEFIVSVGTAEGKEYFRTISFGIISHPQRYISDDTDGDGTNDWDAEYIQHDSPINSGDCGSALVNMKGEVIGINTTKKIETSSGIKAENLSFAIPINLVKTLVVKLEKGETIKRPILGVSIMDVLDILANREAFATPGYATDDGIVIPDDIEFGFYVAEVTEGGVAHKANILPGDIIVAFNDVEVHYSYQLRAQLGNFIIDSGQTTTIVVYRNGEYVTLEVTF